jgi:hypothetical protein
MSALTDAKTWQWSPEVVAYAAKFNVADYLEPLRQMTLQLFPTATSLGVYLEDDPEIRDLTYLIFEIQVPEQDVPNWRDARRRWSDELFALQPPPYQCPFALRLRAATP